MEMSAIGRAGLAPVHWVSMRKLLMRRLDALSALLRGAYPLRAGASNIDINAD